MNEKDNKRYRNVGICVRVTEEEKKFIMDRMKAVGISDMNLFIRKMAITGKCVIHDYSQFFKELKATNYYISSIAKSINQISKRVNSTGNAYEEDIEDMRGQITKLSGYVTELMKAYMPERKDKI